jgi:hypothetical protein
VRGGKEAVRQSLTAMAEPENPLKVLEILQRIFALLDRRSLAQCAQVMKLEGKKIR